MTTTEHSVSAPLIAGAFPQAMQLFFNASRNGGLMGSCVMTRRSPRTSGISNERDLLAVLASFIATPRTLSTPIHRIEADGGFRFTSTLEIRGVTEEALRLFGRAKASTPDSAVTLGLRWTRAPGRFDHFDRLDWRPLDAHNNRGQGPLELRFRLIEGTHHHRLEQNAATDMGLLKAMEDNLPIAEPLLPEPPTREAFLAVAAERWQIANLMTIPYPPWQYGLLPLTGGEGRGGPQRG